MRFYVLPGFVSKSLFGVKLKQSVDEVFELFTNVGILPSSVILCCFNKSLDSLLVFDFGARKGWAIVGHFIGENSDRPQVNLFAITLSKDHFRGIVNGCSGLSLAQLLLFDLFSKSEIS